MGLFEIKRANDQFCLALLPPHRAAKTELLKAPFADRYYH
jgi:hypothetical protein